MSGSPLTHMFANGCRVVIKVYEHRVTTAARDQQLVPEILLHGLLSPHFFFLICIFYFKILQENPRTSVSSRFFFSNLHNVFYNSSRKPSGNSMNSRFLICIFHFIILLGNPHRSTRILIKCLCTSCGLRVVGHEMPWSRVACKSLSKDRDVSP